MRLVDATLHHERLDIVGSSMGQIVVDVLITCGRVGCTRDPNLQVMGFGDTRNLINVEQLRYLC